MSDDVNAKWTIEGAYLQAASPETVHQWLKDQAPKESVHEVTIPEAVLEALRARRSPLIDLGLAQFCVSATVLAPLYRDGDESVKCAVLSNRFLGSIFYRLSRDRLLTDEEHQDLVSRASLPLLEAYLTNPGIGPETLEALFLREEPFAEITEERWTRCVLYAADNTRLHHDFQHKRFSDDGWSDYKHGTPITAAWGLLDTLPPTEEWAAVLTRLYEKMPCRGVPRAVPPAPDADQDRAGQGKTDIVETVWSFSERYLPVELQFMKDNLKKWRSESETADQFWNYFGELRKVISSRVSIHSEAMRSLLRDHDDPFVRRGYYRQFQPRGVEDVRAAFDRDKKDFVEAAIENPWFYRKGRIAVARALYGWVHGDSLGGTDDARFVRARYHALGEHYARKDPQAFAFDEDELSRSEPPDTGETRVRYTRSGFGAIGEQIGEIVLSASRADSDPVQVRSATMQLRDSLEEIEERNREQRLELVQAFRVRLDALAHAQRSNATLLFWVLAIGFAIVVYFRR